MHAAHRIVPSERGETLIEFALSLFVFLMLVVGTLEFGLLVWHYNMTADLAQEGARWAAMHGKNS